MEQREAMEQRASEARAERHVNVGSRDVGVGGCGVVCGWEGDDGDDGGDEDEMVMMVVMMMMERG